MSLRVQSTVGCFTELYFQCLVAQVLAGLRKEFINNSFFLLVLLLLVLFNYNDNNNESNNNNNNNDNDFVIQHSHAIMLALI